MIKIHIILDQELSVNQKGASVGHQLCTLTFDRHTGGGGGGGAGRRKCVLKKNHKTVKSSGKILSPLLELFCLVCGQFN